MFLPICRADLVERGLDYLDFVVVSADAYVDHPSFGHAVISRLVQSQGFEVGVLAQPMTDQDFLQLGAPVHAFLVSGGVVDSMVNNYTAAKRKRSRDVYSPGGRVGRRPDRVLDFYCTNLRRLFPDVPIIIGGIEASLRRLSHYDYWDDAVRQSALVSTGADLLIYGMGEMPILELCRFARRGVPLGRLRDIAGTAYLTTRESAPRPIADTINGVASHATMLSSHARVSSDPVLYCRAFVTASQATSPKASPLIQKQTDTHYVVVNPPPIPPDQDTLDRVYALPYQRQAHPSYVDGVPALEEVEFSVTAHRGCFGGCSFCALHYHQGRFVAARSDDSIIDEVQHLTTMPGFKGYIHDIGGCTANFHAPACSRGHDGCSSRQCIGTEPCPNLRVDHHAYLQLLRRARAVPGVRKVFVRSGVRFDYVMMDSDRTFLDELVRHHVSGQLKVAPEHCANPVLRAMNKPKFEVYERFASEFQAATRRAGLPQYLVPYFISGHPGCTLEHAVELCEYLKSIGYMPEQVQDFYPTPSTLATTMYHTGLDPHTLHPIFVARTPHQKALQRALLQWRLPKNRALVAEAYATVKRPGPGRERK